VNLLIVNDEPATRAGLVELCERSDDLRVIGEASSGVKALRAVDELRPDLLFLNTELPEMGGLDVFRALRRRYQRRTVLLTANTRDAATALAAGALDYLMKPVSAEAFSISILRARECFQPRHLISRGALYPSTLVRSHVAPSRPMVLIGEREHRLYVLDPQKVEYIESAGNYVKYRIANVEYIARETVKRLDAVLSTVGFIRVGRSRLLNIRAIAYAQPIGRTRFAFTLSSGGRFISSPAYRSTILAALPLRRRPPVREGRV
jgi:two-component system LytT family response regulator